MPEIKFFSFSGFLIFSSVKLLQVMKGYRLACFQWFMHYCLEIPKSVWGLLHSVLIFCPLQTHILFFQIVFISFIIIFQLQGDSQIMRIIWWPKIFKLSNYILKYAQSSNTIKIIGSNDKTLSHKFLRIFNFFQKKISFLHFLLLLLKKNL